MIGVKKSNHYFIYFWIGFLLVICLNTFVWLYLNQVDKQFENELKSKLLSMNMLISRLINPAEINAILPQSRTSIEYLYYQQLLEDIARNNNLQSILIISPEYDVLVSAPEILADQSYLNLHSSQAFKTALNGLPAVSDIQSYSGEKFMSAFTPIQNIDGYTIAVISIEAKANYFEIISSLRHRLLLFSLINSALIILIAFFLSIMIRRSLQYLIILSEYHIWIQNMLLRPA